MTWKIFLRIVEIRTKVVSVSTFLLALLSTYYVFGSVNWGLTAVLFFAVLCVDMGTTAFNTFFDFEKGVDSQKTNLESDKVLVHERIPPGYALLTALGLFAFAAVLGIFLVLLTGWILLVLGVLSFVVAFLYSGGPKPISSTPWGEFFAGFFLGVVLWFVVFFVAGSRPEWTPELFIKAFLFSLPSFFFIASILTVNNCCDRVGDREAGRKTLALLWGHHADLLIILLPVTSYALFIVYGIFGLYPSISPYPSVAFLALTVPFWRRMFSRGFDHSTKGPNMQAVTQTFLLFTFCSILNWSLGILLKT